MIRISFSTVLALLLIGCVTAAAAEDPVKKKLDAAKVAYKEAMVKYRKAVEDWFGQRETAARKDGNKKLVDRIKTERQAFQEKDELPQRVPPSLTKMPAIARASLEAAYAAAIKEYTKAKMDDEASATEKELSAFRTGPAATRFKPFQGTWEVKFRGGSTHTYVVQANGVVLYVEGKKLLKLYKNGDDVCVRFEANKLERWSLFDGTLHVEHWHPLDGYAKGVPANDVGKGNKK